MKRNFNMIIRSKAPLRLGIAGGGTDLSPYCDIYGGYVLNMAINMYAYCTLEILPQEEKKIEFLAKDLDREKIFPLKRELEIDDDLPLHIGIYNRLLKDYIDDVVPLRITTYSDAIPGSGLGSSSTMVVTILKAYVDMFRLPLTEYDIANLAYKIEREDLGLSGGKQDQYSATFGGVNFMEFYKNKVIVNPLKIRRWFKNELSSSILLYYTGQSRESANIINTQIKNTKNQINLEFMHEIKKLAFETKEAFLKGNISALVEILNKTWDAKKNTSSAISNSTIDNILNNAKDNGALAGKISGAGGGGFIFFITNPNNKPKLKKALEKHDGRVFECQISDEGASSWYIYN